MSLKGGKFHVSVVITAVEYYLNNQTIEVRCIHKLGAVGHGEPAR